MRTTGGALRSWAVAQAQDSSAVGLLWLIGLYILHVPLAPLWALIAAVMQIVPHFGPILGLLGPVLAATLAWRDWEHPLGFLAFYAVVAVLDGVLLQPYIRRRTARVLVWASIVARIVLGIMWPFCMRTKLGTRGNVRLTVRTGEFARSLGFCGFSMCDMKIYP